MIYVFDWGDTLMVDFPGVPGAMKDWEIVREVEGASALLSRFSNWSKVYVATSANSTPSEIEAALNRVNLGKYIDGYFSPIVLGFCKPQLEFYAAIASYLGVRAKEVTMVGDSLEKDILPAVEAGMSAIWLNSKKQKTNEVGFTEVGSLNEICT